MTAAWTMIIVINLSLILLVMVIKHKDSIVVKPVRPTTRKTTVKKPVVKSTEKKPVIKKSVKGIKK
jgi:hypothetical protein